MQRLTVHLDDELYEAIRASSTKSGQSLSIWIARAARTRLEQIAEFDAVVKAQPKAPIARRPKGR